MTKTSFSDVSIIFYTKVNIINKKLRLIRVKMNVIVVTLDRNNLLKLYRKLVVRRNY